MSQLLAPRRPGAKRPRRWHRPGAGLVALLEILALGVLAAWLVLWVVPSAFQIEWDCVSTSGARRVGGDSYAAAVVLAGTFGWLLVAIGVISAQIAESRRATLLLPLAWFAVFVVAALVAAAAMGAQPCPG